MPVGRVTIVDRPMPDRRDVTRRPSSRRRSASRTHWATSLESHRRHSPTSTSTPSSRCSTGRPGSTSWWPRRWPTGSRRSGSPITATCTGRWSSTRSAASRASSRSSAPRPTWPTTTAASARRAAAASTTPAATPRAARSSTTTSRCWPRATRGYRNLIHLSSRAFLEGYYYKPRLDWELLAEHSEGLIATTGCLGGHVLQSLLQGDERGALEKAGRLQEIFGRDNLFVELQDHGLPAQRETNPKLIELAQKLGAPLLATNDSHYTHREDHESHDALLCVQTGAVLSDPKRFKFEGHEHYLKTADEMRYLFRELPGGVRQHAVDRRAGRRRRSSSATPLLPNFPLPEGFTDDTGYLAHVTWQGARERWGDDVPEVDEATASSTSSTRSPTMGFSSYFLIVWDLIKHARDGGIRVGPGRGSAAGCAVAYCLRITDLDPIRYDLLFERFLNPSRISMPDIDMDFDSRYRDEMIRYAAERYGRDHVAQIITFGTIKARNAVRDAARVLGFPYGVGDRIAKAMPPLVMGRDTPLKYCFEQHPKYADGYKAASELRAMYDTDTDVKKVVDVAKGLEGLKRSDGIHAAAVVITKEPLTEYLPVQRKPESGQPPELAPVVTQYEMHGVEELGLLKMDFLGLRNLDVISDTVAMLRAGARPRLRHRRHPARRRAARSSCCSAAPASACSSWRAARCGP